MGGEHVKEGEWEGWLWIGGDAAKDEAEACRGGFVKVAYAAGDALEGVRLLFVAKKGGEAGKARF